MTQAGTTYFQIWLLKYIFLRYEITTTVKKIKVTSFKPCKKFKYFLFYYFKNNLTSNTTDILRGNMIL